jgi:hypothetical protein
MVAQVGYSVAGRSRGRVTLCVVCTVDKEMRSVDFLVEPQNLGRRFVSSLPSKPLGQVVSGLTSKALGRFLPVFPQNRWWRVSQFGPQNWQFWFDDLGVKIIVTVSCFGSQNQAGYGLLVTTTKLMGALRWRGHASRSSGLLRLEAGQGRVFQSDLKTGGGVARMVHVASS